MRLAIGLALGAALLVACREREVPLDARPAAVGPTAAAPPDDDANPVSIGAGIVRRPRRRRASRRRRDPRGEPGQVRPGRDVSGRARSDRRRRARHRLPDRSQRDLCRHDRAHRVRVDRAARRAARPQRRPREAHRHESSARSRAARRSTRTAPRAAPLGDSNGLEVGEWLVVLGDPFGDDVTASAGIVSATGREGAGSLAAGRDDGLSHVHADRRADPPRQLRRSGDRHRRSSRRRRRRDRRSARRAVVRDPDRTRPRGHRPAPRRRHRRAQLARREGLAGDRRERDELRHAGRAAARWSPRSRPILPRRARPCASTT